jgi:hypothetical protein
VLLNLRQAVRQVTLLNALGVPVRVSARPTPRLYAQPFAFSNVVSRIDWQHGGHVIESLQRKATIQLFAAVAVEPAQSRCAEARGGTCSARHPRGGR